MTTCVVIKCGKTVGCTILAMVVMLGLVCHGMPRDDTASSKEARRLRADSTARSNEGRRLPRANFKHTNAKKPFKIIPNLIFVKPHKIGGTTMGGIVRRIASRHGGITAEYKHRLLEDDFFGKTWNVPKLDKDPDAMHMWANHLTCRSMSEDADQTVFEQAFKFTMTRDPVDRCMSQFYYDTNSGSREVMREAGIMKGMEYHPDPSGDEPATTAKIEYIEHCMEESVYFYGRCSEDQTMLDVLNTYQLVGIVERWVDTISIMKMKLDLNYGDILHLPGKVNDARPSAAGGRFVAAGIARPPLSEEPQMVIDAISTRPETAIDGEFWKMANERMDEQIAELTPDGFPEVRGKVDRLLSELKEYCAHEVNNPQYTDKEIAAWRKESHGDEDNIYYLDCYWKDHGCGMKCMDKFAKERDLNNDY
ncbi:unnamed protein product [Discosporangium mesarthrocarpum]